MANIDNESDIDFYGIKAESERQEKQKQKILKHQKFLKVGKNALKAIGFGAVLFGVSFGIQQKYENNRTEKINAIEKTLHTIPQNQYIKFIDGEKSFAQQLFMNNQLLINNHGQYKDIIEALNIGNQLSINNANNAKLYKETIKALDNDKVLINTAFGTLNADRNEKLKVYVDGGINLNKFNELTIHAKDQDKHLMYVSGLIELGKDLTTNIKNLETTQNKIINEVKTKLKNKEFNLEAAKQKFTENVVNQSNTDIDEVKSIRKELLKTSELVAEDQNGRVIEVDPTLKNMLTEEDVQNAESAINVYKNEALSQINKDQENVKSLLSKVEKDSTNTTNSDKTNTNTHSGPSFLDYYLMYHWMNVLSNNNNMTNNNNVKSPTPLIQNNLYNLKDQNSHINKSLAQSTTDSKGNINKATQNNKSPIPAKPDLSKVKANIEAMRSKAAQAQSAKTSVISKMQSISKSSGTNVANKATIAKSGRAGFGGRSGGFGGHSGGFGG